jgi:hypothetical protein
MYICLSLEQARGCSNVHRLVTDSSPTIDTGTGRFLLHKPEGGFGLHTGLWPRLLKMDLETCEWICTLGLFFFPQPIVNMLLHIYVFVFFLLSRHESVQKHEYPLHCISGVSLFCLGLLCCVFCSAHARLSDLNVLHFFDLDLDPRERESSKFSSSQKFHFLSCCPVVKWNLTEVSSLFWFFYGMPRKERSKGLKNEMMSPPSSLPLVRSTNFLNMKLSSLTVRALLCISPNSISLSLWCERSIRWRTQIDHKALTSNRSTNNCSSLAS